VNEGNIGWITVSGRDTTVRVMLGAMLCSDKPMVLVGTPWSGENSSAMRCSWLSVTDTLKVSVPPDWANPAVGV